MLPPLPGHRRIFFYLSLFLFLLDSTLLLFLFSRSHFIFELSYLNFFPSAALLTCSVSRQPFKHFPEYFNLFPHGSIHPNTASLFKENRSGHGIYLHLNHHVPETPRSRSWRVGGDAARTLLFSPSREQGPAASLIHCFERFSHPLFFSLSLSLSVAVLVIKI